MEQLEMIKCLLEEQNYKSVTLYNFIANQWYKFEKEELREIILNLLYAMTITKLEVRNSIMWSFIKEHAERNDIEVTRPHNNGEKREWKVRKLGDDE